MSSLYKEILRPRKLNRKQNQVLTSSGHKNVSENYKGYSCKPLIRTDFFFFFLIQSHFTLQELNSPTQRLTFQSSLLGPVYSFTWAYLLFCSRKHGGDTFSTQDWSSLKDVSLCLCDQYTNGRTALGRRYVFNSQMV